MYYDPLIGDVPSKENLMLRIYIRMLCHNYKITGCVKDANYNGYKISMSNGTQDWMSVFYVR